MRLIPFMMALIAASQAPALYAQQKPAAGTARFSFSGYEWTVKRSERPTAPHDNRFGGLGENVFLREDGSLALRIARGEDGLWRSAEVILSRPLGYGTYRFSLASRLDRYDDAVVAGIFTWDTASPYEHRELDIEFSTWGGQVRYANSQYVVQPNTLPGRLHRFTIAQEGDLTSHELRWEEGRAGFASWHGHGDRPASGSPLLISEWEYAGTGVPPPGNERLRFNLYLFEGKPPADGRTAEFVVTSFRFEPIRK